MSQPERIRDIPARPAYAWLRKTPDLSAPPRPLSRDELDEAKALLDYEEQLRALRAKRGF